jgi:putative acetyltransferase
MLIRAERQTDIPGIHRLITQVFPTSGEAELVAKLRQQASPLISLVADVQGQIAGHVMLSPVTHQGRTTTKLMGLAPLAVSPEKQRQGIGKALVKAAMASCYQSGAGAIVVVGEPDYYCQFGFMPATLFAIHCQFKVPAEAFMAVELEPAALAGVKGLVCYHQAFADFS